MSKGFLVAAASVAALLAGGAAWAQTATGAAPPPSGNLAGITSSGRAERGADVPGVALAVPDGSAGIAYPGGWRAWGQYLYSYSRTGADRDKAAVTTRGQGFSVGVERNFDPTLTLGVSVGYVDGDATSRGVRAGSESVTGSVYGWWNPWGGLEFDGVVGITGGSTDTRRNVTYWGAPMTIVGSADSLGASVLGSVGYRHRFDSAFGQAWVKPFLSLAYGSQRREAYNETAIIADLAFPGKSFDRASSTLGVALGTDVSLGYGWTIRPEVSVGWTRYLTNPSPAVPAVDTATGNLIVLRDPRPGRDGLAVGAELALWRTASLQAFVGYGGEFRDNGQAHLGRVGLRATW